MLSSGSGGQPRRARGRVQADPGSESGTSGLRFRLAPAVRVVLALLLSGCASLPGSLNPVSWWHDLQGGKIAEERPPPPGADQPYPNLATVPPKPPPADLAAMTNLSNGLIADRANAQHLASLAPLADPSSPSASPELFGKGTVPPPPPPPPPGTKTASASLPGAEAPPAPPLASQAPAAPSAASGPVPAPSKAPIGAVQSAPLEPPVGTAQSASPPAPAGAPQTTPPVGGTASSNPMAQAPGVAENAPLAPPGATALPTAANGPPPPLPTTPPPPPNFAPAPAAPAPAPASATAPAPAAPAAPPQAAAQVSPPAQPPAAAPPPAAAAPPPATPIKTASLTPTPSPPGPPNPADTVSVTFITGSSDLPALASTTLKQLAGRRGSGIIAVTGYGEAASNDPDAQSAALTLGLSRAKAMAAALTAAGVPATAIQVDAQAVGRGGTARLVQ